MINLKNVILVVSSVFILITSGVAVGSNFSGQWCWDKDSDVSAFSIVINKVSGMYRGGYCSVTLSGNRIDDNDMAFSFKATDKNIIKTKLKAGITGNIGLIQLENFNDKKLVWLVLQEPKGEIYVPQKAILHRCK